MPRQPAARMNGRMGRRETFDRPVRVAVLIHTDQQLEDWEVSVFERLTTSDRIELSAFLISTREPARYRRSLAFRAVNAIDALLFGKARRVTLEEVLGRFSHVPAMQIDERPASDRFDVVLSHLRGPVEQRLTDDATRLWEYHFNAESGTNPEAFGFVEALTSAPVTNVALVERRRDGTTTDVGSCPCNTKFSAAFNAAYAKGMLPSLVERELLRSTLGQGTDSKRAPRPVTTPGFTQSMQYLGNLSLRLARRAADVALKKFGAQPKNWTLLVGSADALQSGQITLRELRQPAGGFRADPFLFEYRDETWVFYESCANRDGVGRIEAGRIEGDQIVDISKVVLGGSHRSFPFVFERSGEIFMIPETHANDRVEVWKCDNFPNKWSLHSYALEGRSPADTVFIDWQGESWLLTNLAAGTYRDHCIELHAFKVDGPELKTVEAHPLNPVVLDTTRARNAGRPFIRDGRLIRPAQINSNGTYGYGLKFLEITDLSMTSYREREIRKVIPNVAMRTTGCHHFDATGSLFIMDARRAYGSRLMGARPISLEAV